VHYEKQPAECSCHYVLVSPYFRAGRSSPRIIRRIDRARPGGSFDEGFCFKRKHHLMHRGRCNSEVPLHVGLRRRTLINFGVVVNERQDIDPA